MSRHRKNDDVPEFTQWNPEGRKYAPKPKRKPKPRSQRAPEQRQVGRQGKSPEQIATETRKEMKSRRKRVLQMGAGAD